VLKTKGILQGRENLTQQKRSAEAETFIEKYRVTGGNTYDTKTRKVKCNVMWGGVPEASIQVRLLEKEGVQQVVDSFCELGIKQPMEIVGVIWEDPKNRAGGCFSYKVSNKNVYEVWKELTYVVVGDTVSNQSSFVTSVSGITISPKKNFCIIKIWMTNCNHQNASVVTQEIKELSSHGCIFKKHAPEY
jgi:hypothetical protein